MRRTPAEARALGLWTAAWLAVLLVAGLLWLGDIRLQWPVLVIPLLWALVALARGRRRAPSYREVPPDVPRHRPPETRELPYLPEVPRDRRDQWDER